MDQWLGTDAGRIDAQFLEHLTRVLDGCRGATPNRQPSPSILAHYRCS